MHDAKAFTPNVYGRCFTTIEFLMCGKLFKFFSKVIFYVIEIHLTTWPRAQGNNTFHNNIPSSCKPNVSGVIWRIFGKRFGSFLIFHSDLDKFYGFYGPMNGFIRKIFFIQNNRVEYCSAAISKYKCFFLITWIEYLNNFIFRIFLLLIHSLSNVFQYLEKFLRFLFVTSFGRISQYSFRISFEGLFMWYFH